MFREMSAIVHSSTTVELENNGKVLHNNTQDSSSSADDGRGEEIPPSPSHSPSSRDNLSALPAPAVAASARDFFVATCVYPVN